CERRGQRCSGGAWRRCLARRARAPRTTKGGEVTEHSASCRCGQLRAVARGDPVRVSVCHCLACQKRTGSAFSAQARWPAECVEIEGVSKEWTRTADSGQITTYSFCPECGSTGHYTGGNFPDVIASPV